jgi:hypothetical protein
MFGFASVIHVYLALDNVSVVDTANLSVELLVNPNFANLTLNLTGWTIMCSTSCTGGTGGTIITTNCLADNCFRSECNSGHEYLVQSFPATVGHTYNISFWSQRVKYLNTGSGAATLYVGIL